MYLAMLVLFVSLGLTIANWFILVYAAAIWLALRLFALPREEARLVAMFGDEYESYRRRTGAFLPRLLTKTRVRRT